MRTKWIRDTLGLAFGCWLCFCAALAGPWAEVGDSNLRSDILVLSAAGLIDDVTMQWPLPWSGILARLCHLGALNDQPAYVRDAAMRVRERGLAEIRPRKSRASLTVDGASAPSVVRGFDAMGQSTVQGQVIFERMWDTTALHLAAGARTVSRTDRQLMMFDGTYIAQLIDNAVVTAGYKTHWWGPGWFSAMSLSNNARPMPQIGISRNDTSAFKSPWLSWIGPWQAEFFVGLLDGQRVAKNTVYTGFRFAFSPLPHLEIGFARTTEMCGTGHSCKPLAGYFNVSNDSKRVNTTNDEGNIDIRYSGAFSGWAYETYVQFMNEDTNPIQHSGSSHLAGASVWLPVEGGVGRLTVEYADSVATYDLWGSGTMHGFAYNNYDYTDGMRYRGRSLGFSLDSDSRLLSVQANYARNEGDSYTLTVHRAEVSNPLNTGGNAVTTAPVTINLAEARWKLPLRLGEHTVLLDIAARVQDDRPRPDKGALVSVEAALTINL